MSYIKLDRQIVDWEWFEDNNMLKLWIYILTQVNYEDKSWRGEFVPKGSMITSIDHLAKKIGLTTQNVRTLCKKLEKTKEITIKSTNKYTQIYVNKWEQFQCCDDETNKQTNKQLTNNQQTTNKQLTTTKEYKEIKERKEYIFNPSWNYKNKMPIYDDSNNSNVDMTELNTFLEERGKA